MAKFLLIGAFFGGVKSGLSRISQSWGLLSIFHDFFPQYRSGKKKGWGVGNSSNCATVSHFTTSFSLQDVILWEESRTSDIRNNRKLDSRDHVSKSAVVTNRESTVPGRRRTFSRWQGEKSEPLIKILRDNLVTEWYSAAFGSIVATLEVRFVWKTHRTSRQWNWDNGDTRSHSTEVYAIGTLHSNNRPIVSWIKVSVFEPTNRYMYLPSEGL